MKLTVGGSSEELLTLDAALNVVLLQGITEHQAPLADIQFNGVASISGGTEVSEGGGHGVRCVDVTSIGSRRAVQAPRGTVPQLACPSQPRSRRILRPVDPGASGQALLHSWFKKG